MSFWSTLFGGNVQREAVIRSDISVPADSTESGTDDKEIQDTLKLGWYWSEAKGERRMARIAEKDRSTHFYVVGATGTGKTKFLEFLIRQDIENGNGFGIIDPHGDLIEDIKGFLACRNHERRGESEISERVVLIDPTDARFTVTFNPLERLPNVSAAEQAAELVSAFKKIWAESWGVRMEDLMRNSLIALAEAGLTLLELPSFLTVRAFREFVTTRVTHPIAKEYFRRFDSLTDRGQSGWIEPVMNKINAFLSDPRIGQMFSAPQSSFKLREIMDNRKILLVKLDKGKLHGAADLLGSLLMAKIQMAAFSRADVAPSKRTPFYLYIDEFQNFASESFLVVLSEARKYGLSLVMAHQTLAQISPEMRGMILGNTGIQVYFRVNRQDASLLAKEAFEYSGFEVKTVRGLRPAFWSLGEEWEHHTEELQRLSPRTCYVKHKIEGGIIPISTAEIEPAWQVLDMGEEEYAQFLKETAFGRKYLVAREKLVNLMQRKEAAIRAIRAKSAAKQIREKKPVEVAPVPPPAVKKEPEKAEPVVALKEPEVVSAPVMAEPDTDERQHRYLQGLIKRMAEEKGFRAIIEQPTPDGQGRIDVGLERDGKRIGCEISVTSTDEQELSNIEKCLKAGCEKVILCSAERRSLEKIKALVSQKLSATELEKVLFLQPDELLAFLEAEAALAETKEERVKGYRVKVQYHPVTEPEKKAKRQAIAQVIVGALRRMKGGDSSRSSASTDPRP